MILAAILSLIACEQDEEVSYSQFNGSNDTMTISVGVEELLPSSSIDLNSTTGLVVVGSASVDYSGGPVNTTHTFRYQVMYIYCLSFITRPTNGNIIFMIPPEVSK